MAAEVAHVENRCPRLSAPAYEELDARILLLLLKEEAGKLPLPVVVCDSSAAWVEWRGQTFPLSSNGSLVDEVVDIVEAHLHEPRPTAASKRTGGAAAAVDEAVAAGRPVLQAGGTPPPLPPDDQRADPLARRADDARGGGIAIGIETEGASETVGATLGPIFDVGASVGPLLLGGREAVRLTLEGRRLVFMDFEGAIGYGAPFNPDALFGCVARFGAEWMVAYPEGNSGQAVVAPVIDFGLRTQHSFGLVSGWLGLDTHFRLATLSLGTASPVTANDVGLSFSLGIAFVDWSRK